MNFILDEPKTTTFITTFSSSEDGIKSTSRKLTQSENVVVEEVLSEPEQEKEAIVSNVEIEEVDDDVEGKLFLLIGNIFIYTFNKYLLCRFIKQ